MSFTTTTPNMNLVLPIPTQELGPAWAVELNSALALVDSHDHSSGKGAQVTPAGLNINSDLPINQHNLIYPRSVRLFPYANTGAFGASAPDGGALFQVLPDLYYYDGSNTIRITQSGSVAGSSGTITGLPSGTASAAFSAGSGTFIFQQATSTAANIDAGTLIVRYPGSYPAPTGNYIAIQAPTSLSGGYAITLPGTTPGSNGALVTTSTAGIQSYTNVDNSTLQIASAVMSVRTITASQIASATITGTQIASNVNLAGKSVQENGSNVIVSSANAANSLAIIRGTVSGAGSSTAGEGFGVNRNSVGNYTITFTNAFNDLPVVTFGTILVAGGAVVIQAAITSLSSSTLNLDMVTSGGSLIDTTFHFIAIGQRT